MFDIGFLELVLLGVVGLVVLGPDRLPGALRTAGLWIGRLRRSFNAIKADIEREVGADEIRRQLRNEAIMEKIKNTRSQVTQSLDSVKDSVTKEAEAVKKDLSLADEFEEMAGVRKSEPAAPPPPPIPPRPGGGEGQAPTTGESAAVPPPAPAEPSPEPAPAQQAERKDSGQQ